MGKSLWGNLEELDGEIKTPKEFLEEQAEALKEILDGLVKGRVSRIAVRQEWKDFYDGLNVECDFSFSLEILSDYVADYEYQICKVAYGIKLYPIAISFDQGIEEVLRGKFEIHDGDTIVVADEEEFLMVLQEILSSDEIHNILRGLVSIAKKERAELPFA